MATGTKKQTGTAKTRFESGDLASMKRSEGQRHSEGVVARTIEDQTAKLPSDLFLWSALGCAGVSCMLHCSGDHADSRFVGQWVAPLLILGVYNKLVKVHGSDRVHFA
jgi:hypothetical protein